MVGHIDIHTPAPEDQEVDEEEPPATQDDKDGKDYDPELDQILAEAVNPRKRKRVSAKKTELSSGLQAGHFAELENCFSLQAEPPPRPTIAFTWTRRNLEKVSYIVEDDPVDIDAEQGG